MKKSSLRFWTGVMVVGALLANSGPVHAVSASATIRVTCTILPTLEVSSRAPSGTAARPQYLTTQSILKKDRVTFQIRTVTAL